MLLMLEDDADRLTRFAAVLERIVPTLPVRTWRNAHRMIEEAGSLLPSASIICLDHDLEPDKESVDPGDGYMVAKWLTAQPIMVPVVIHTSNRVRSDWIAGEFDLSGWRHWRVPPLGDDWIETDWRRTVRRLLRTQKGRALSFPHQHNKDSP